MGCDGNVDDPNVLDMDLEDDTEANHLSTIAGVKRAPTMYDDKQPSVRVVYNSLTRESKRKLAQLMQQWSEWEAKSQSSQASQEDILEDGEEIYFPALCVGSGRSSSVSFWIDNLGRKETVEDFVQLNTVPLYDRGCKLGSSSADGISNNEGTSCLDDSRCFNCQSYGHSLKDCPMPRDNVAISNARKLHSSKRSQSSSNREHVRYYKKAAGKFDGLQPGVLGPETRESLGIGEHDPPPWLHRMRDMGYPPGYLDVAEDEDQPSGITIYAEEETKEEYEDGELPETAEPVPPKRKMTVEFPGINAPLPANADQWLWGSPSTGYSSSSAHSRHITSTYVSSEAQHRAGYVLSSPSPRYDDYRMARNPNLERSFSDRGSSFMNHSSSLHSVNHSPSYDTWKPDMPPPSSSFHQGRENRGHQNLRSHYNW